MLWRIDVAGIWRGSINAPAQPDGETRPVSLK
jgi:hypothetical protein